VMQDNDQLRRRERQLEEEVRYLRETNTKITNDVAEIELKQKGKRNHSHV
jgi:predicted transglutaminase-like protease